MVNGQCIVFYNIHRAELAPYRVVNKVVQSALSNPDFQLCGVASCKDVFSCQYKVLRTKRTPVIRSILYIKHQVEFAKCGASLETLVGYHHRERRVHTPGHQAVNIVERHLRYSILVAEGILTNQNGLVVVNRAWVVVYFHL